MARRADSQLDRLLGLEYYGLDGAGTGGKLRSSLDDFIVREISIDGEVASPECKYAEGAGEFTWLVLEKRKIDTVSAARAVARFFGLKLRDVGIAGLKDTSAVTYQFISIPGEVKMESIEEFNLSHKRVKLHCPFRRPFALKPGMLYGNFFNVKVRGAECLECLEALLRELKEKKAVPNYYGYQRFGTVRPVTHVVGRMILLGEFKEAVEELIYKVFPGESQVSRRARLFLSESGDPLKALELFPKSLKSERAVLRHLARHPGDYVGALRAVSPYVKKLFIGAYQAYLFNKLLSKRIERGLSYYYPVPGDTVGIFREKRGGEVTGVLKVNDANVEKVKRWIDEGFAVLLLPVFGYNSNLSHGVVGEIERELLREEGIDVSMFRVKQIPEASSAGTYRYASLVPHALNVRVFGNDYELTFVLNKGAYATTLLRELVKPVEPARQGF
ncbi:tRNA pseudouridine(13) synthase TruD [Thermofilum pendens]|uniref:Probable tRNA pseudouridine synthase D n=1 Tax=Thermofilum pendens (strain DSM 2475 / Hrk 5) TaxID=368408 RepID=A1RY07_THEPD|nr:tRNA pseudouridine(13) synthase TruD [Thermofilum pendens]ABL78087.1 Pseudouridylate synthase [Thermofilum pendens Hrk 5]